MKLLNRHGVKLTDLSRISNQTLDNPQRPNAATPKNNAEFSLERPYTVREKTRFGGYSKYQL